MRINKNFFYIIGLLTFLVVFLLFLKILQRKSPSTPQPALETPTPTIPITSPTPSSQCSLNKNISSKLPVVTKNYTIEYFPVPQKFFVMILANPYEEYEAEAEKWLISYGIDPNGLCVFWTSAKGVAPKAQ